MTALNPITLPPYSPDIDLAQSPPSIHKLPIMRHSRPIPIKPGERKQKYHHKTLSLESKTSCLAVEARFKHYLPTVEEKFDREIFDILKRKSLTTQIKTSEKISKISSSERSEFGMNLTQAILTYELVFQEKYGKLSPKIMPESLEKNILEETSVLSIEAFELMHKIIDEEIDPSKIDESVLKVKNKIEIAMYYYKICLINDLVHRTCFSTAPYSSTQRYFAVSK